MAKTEFNDKHGKPIYVGDIVQYRLSLNLKHGGPRLYKILQNKKGVIQLGDPQNEAGIKIPLTKTYLPYITIFDTKYRIN